MSSEHMERLEFGAEAVYNPVEAAIHTARYLLASGACRGARVLDASCGEGYGSFLMAGEWGAASVVGFDVSADALARARQLFQRPNLRFQQGDALQLETLLAGERFDLVVSLETIEHLADPAAFLRAIRALLAPGGTAIVSCPNDHWYYPDAETRNPYHLRKYTFEEFAALMGEVFPEERRYLLGLPVVGYGNFPAGTDGRLARPAGSMVELTLEAAARSPRALTVAAGGEIPPALASYYVCVVGGPADLPSLSVYPQSMAQHTEYERAIETQTRLIDERNAYIRDLEARVDAHVATIRNMDKMIEERVAYIQKLEKTVDERAELLKTRDRQVGELEAQLKLQSKRWFR